MSTDAAAIEKSLTNKIENYLMEQSPASVIELYSSLPERTSSTDFGGLVSDLIFLDTETTGLFIKQCHLIEIAAARIHQGRVVERFQTFVNPGQPIPAEIQQLTSIKDIDVADAPDEETAVAALADFTLGLPVIAHNAAFDRKFIERVPGGKEVSPTWIDSLALSRMALPRFKTHRLSDLAQAFGCDTVTHRAMDDVNALVGVWPHLLRALMDLPDGLVQFIADMHPDVDWPYRFIFSQLAEKLPQEPFFLTTARLDQLKNVQLFEKNDPNELNGNYLGATQNQIETDFGKDGALSHIYPKFEPREVQKNMALAVNDALLSSQHLSVEAGTGVGKSMAYLLPALHFARKNNVVVGVATKTNALTDQLASHEIPALVKEVAPDALVTTLKGYEHYPCLYRMENAATSELPLAAQEQRNKSWSGYSEAEMLTTLAVCYAYCSQSVDGDLDALGIRWAKVPREMVTISARECLRSRCPYYNAGCMVHGARRRAAASDLVLTNHSMLLRDVDMDGRILPSIRHWIIDEAHSFEEEARQQWSREVSNTNIREGFERLGTHKMGALAKIAKDIHMSEKDKLSDSLYGKLVSEISSLQIVVASVVDAIFDLNKLLPDSPYDQGELWIDEQVREEELFQMLVGEGVRAIDKLEQVLKCVEDLYNTLKSYQPQAAADLLDATSFLTDLHDNLMLILTGEDNSYVYAAQLVKNKKDIAKIGIYAQKIDIGESLAKKWFPEMESAIFCSATMSVRNNFDHFNHAIGLDLLDTDSHTNLRFNSDFDYQKQMAALVISDMPEPNNPNYMDALAETLIEIHKAMEGSVLTLFTNRREMDRCFKLVEPELSKVGLKLSKQDVNSSPRYLREAFIKEKSRSLFALKSFWEGFDAGGDTLRCVVIPKLPFSSPFDPLQKERSLRDSSAWWHYSLPEAIIEVKQAAGRLIRSKKDTGVLILADSRLVSKRYGRDFIESLPTGSASNLERAHLSRYLEMWRQSHDK